jgi:integrase
VRVDLSGDEPLLRIPAALDKGRKNRESPITPDFVEFLLATPEDERHGRVFPAVTHSREDASRTIGAIGRAAGVKIKTKANEEAQFATAHDLRRSFGARWAALVMPGELQELMRHEHITTTMTFYVGKNARRTSKSIREAFNRSRPNTFPNSGLETSPSDTPSNERKSLPAK